MESWQIMSLLEMLIISGSVLGGLGILTYAWVKRRPHMGKSELAGLTDSVNTLRESVEGMREEIGEVSERLEFTERVLTRIAETGSPRDQRLPKP